jgi:hypothetical protein
MHWMVRVCSFYPRKSPYYSYLTLVFMYVCMYVLMNEQYAMHQVVMQVCTYVCMYLCVYVDRVIVGSELRLYSRESVQSSHLR